MSNAKHFWTLLLFAIWTIAASAYPSTRDGYKLNIDLTTVENDQLKIVLEVPSIDRETTEYHMPRIVPGTYNISDFGRFISDFEALDTNGRKLKVKKIDENRWKIFNAQSLQSIQYQIDDTFDGEPGKEIFEPAGSNFQVDTNFVLNLFAMVGYLEGSQTLPYSLEVKHPESLYGATALKVVKRTTNRDQFWAPDYFTMHDSPIMYSYPDTASLQVANAVIEVMVYSPGKVLSAMEVMERNKDLFLAAADYLGGKLPVERYTQLIYLWDGPTHTGAMGALEHSFSTVFSLPDLPDSVMGGEIRNISAHEFFHIVTPLTIHSEEIHNYNWITPQMSEHLWFYEGVTEYVSHHMQVVSGLITEEEFMQTMREKMLTSTQQFDDALPFTTMSANCLDIYEHEYGNVYQKGALIGMCLDISLLDWSGGKYGIQDLIADLQERYGRDRAFKDEEFFDVIAEITSADLREFFVRHLESYEPLPFEEIFEKVDYNYSAYSTDTIITFGNIALGYNPDTDRLFVADLRNANTFGRSLGYLRGDELLSINGFDLSNPAKVSENIQKWRENTREGKKVVVRVARPSGDGFEVKKLKAKAELDVSKTYHILSASGNPSLHQQAIQNAWLKPRGE